MAAVTLAGAGQLVYPLDLRALPGSRQEHTMAESLGYPSAMAFGGRVFFKERTGTKSITRVGFFAAGSNGGFFTSLRISLHNFHGSAFGPAADELAAIVMLDADTMNGWQRTDPLDTSVEVSYGQLLAVQITFQFYDAGSLVYLYSYDPGGGGESRGFPWVAERQTGSSDYTATGTLPNIVLEFTDGTFGMLDGSIPILGSASASIASTDYVGLQFRLPWAVKIDALAAMAAPQGNDETETTTLLIMQGETVLGSTEIDEAEHTAGGERLIIVPLIEEVELEADTDYIVAIRPNNNASATVNYFDLADAGHRVCIGDLNLGYLTRPGGGAWSSPTTTSIPRLGIRISAVGEGGVILLAAGGSYTVTGSPATLKVGRKLIAESGSYAVTGFAANLQAPTHRLTADGGTYSYTGAAASLLYGRKLLANSGLYVTVGWPATLRATRKLVADSGNYAVTGFAANLQHSRGLSAASGSYAVTGFAANLHRGFRLDAASGSYTTTGSSADLLAARTLLAGSGIYVHVGWPTVMTFNRRLTADGGSYDVTGFDAALAAEGVLLVEGGSYEYTGSTAALLAGRKLLAAAGEYTTTGFTATLLAGRYLAAESGSYAVTGSTAELTVENVIDCRRSSAVYVSSPWRSMIPFPDGTVGVTDRRKVAYYYCADFGYSISTDAGSYTVTGFAATLTRTYLMPAAGGSYLYTGSMANLLAARRLSVDAGSYGVTGFDATLTVARKLTAASGGYNVEGAMAALAQGYHMTAEPGSYDVVGEDAGTYRGFHLAAEPGEYDVTGEATGLLATRLLLVEPGEYTWTGEAAGLTIARKLVAAGGSYSVTGVDAALIQFRPNWTSQFNYLVDDIFEP
jgi:hypothetical protein